MGKGKGDWQFVLAALIRDALGKILLRSMLFILSENWDQIVAKDVARIPFLKCDVKVLILSLDYE